jgi:hypothetical protein
VVAKYSKFHCLPPTRPWLISVRSGTVMGAPRRCTEEGASLDYHLLLLATSPKFVSADHRFSFPHEEGMGVMRERYSRLLSLEWASDCSGSIRTSS